MKIIISPAKKLDFDSSLPENIEKIFRSSKKSDPLKKDREELLKWIPKDKSSLKKLMHLSDSLADLNAKRYSNWQSAKTCPAIFAFRGDVYKGLDVTSLSKDALVRLQENLLILSGLYGVLRPFDEIKPHRLEMGTKLKTPAGQTLYDFWQGKIANQISKQLTEKEIIVNLASKEYFLSVAEEFAKKSIKVITPVFLDRVKNSKNKYATIGLFAKRARGMMTRFIIEKKVNTPNALENFNSEGYIFSHWGKASEKSAAGKAEGKLGKNFQNHDEQFIVFQRD